MDQTSWTTSAILISKGLQSYRRPLWGLVGDGGRDATSESLEKARIRIRGEESDVPKEINFEQGGSLFIIQI